MDAKQQYVFDKCREFDDRRFKMESYLSSVKQNSVLIAEFNVSTKCPISKCVKKDNCKYSGDEHSGFSPRFTASIDNNKVNGNLWLTLHCSDFKPEQIEVEHEPKA